MPRSTKRGQAGKVGTVYKEGMVVLFGSETEWWFILSTKDMKGGGQILTVRQYGIVKIISDSMVTNWGTVGASIDTL